MTYILNIFFLPNGFQSKTPFKKSKNRKKKGGGNRVAIDAGVSYDATELPQKMP